MIGCLLSQCRQEDRLTIRLLTLWERHSPHSVPCLHPAAIVKPRWETAQRWFSIVPPLRMDVIHGQTNAESWTKRLNLFKVFS